MYCSFTYSTFERKKNIMILFAAHNGILLLITIFRKIKLNMYRTHTSVILKYTKNLANELANITVTHALALVGSKASAK